MSEGRTRAAHVAEIAALRVALRAASGLLRDLQRAVSTLERVLGQVEDALEAGAEVPRGEAR